MYLIGRGTGCFFCVLALLLMIDHRAWAGNKFYVGPATGNWNTSANWSSTLGGAGSAGVPTNGDDVYITDTASVTRQINYDYTGAAVTLNTLTLDNTAMPVIVGGGIAYYVDSLTIPANNNLTVSLNETAGLNGAAIINQNGGTNTFGRILELGTNTTSTFSVYNLAGGSLFANAPTSDSGLNSNYLVYTGEFIGGAGIGIFNQTGGTNTIGTAAINEALYLGFSAQGAGSYNLSNAASSLTVNGPEYIGYQSSTYTSTFTQTGGSHVVNGLFDIAADSNASGSYTLSGGTFNAAMEYIGAGGNGSFVQTAGSNSASGTIALAVFKGSAGGYTLSGSGTLSANAEAIGGQTTEVGGGVNPIFTVGGTGYFSQNGGTNTITGSDTTGYSFNVFQGSTYKITAGTLILPTVGYAAVNYGSFNLSGTGILKGSLINYANVTFDSFDQLTSGFLMTGGTVDAAANIYNSNGGIDIGGGTFSGALRNAFLGHVNMSGGLINGTVINDGYFTISAGTFSATAVTGLPQNSPNGTFLLQGGSINTPVFSNQGLFTYYGGTITGQLINNGSASMVGTGLSISNGMQNAGTLTIGSPLTATQITFSGAGLDNTNLATLNTGSAVIGTVINDYGATLITNGTTNVVGTLTNLGIFQPASVTVSGAMTNAGTVTITSSNALAAQGGVTNTGTITLQGGRLTGGAIVNNPRGNVTFAPAAATTLYGFSQSVSNSGGMIVIGTDDQVTFANFAGNTLGGDIQIQTGATLIGNAAFSNTGTIELLAATSALGGGTITNTGSITAQGTISNSLLNTGGTVEATAKLVLSGASPSNSGGGQILIDAGVNLQFTQGLSTNSGTLYNNAGTFDNNSHALTNASGGVIDGSGTFRTGAAGLTNAAGGVISLSGTSNIYGLVTNSGSIGVFNASATFYSAFTQNAGGSIRVTGGTLNFLGNVSVTGVFTSVSSADYFTTLTINSGGSVTGGSTDSFYPVNGISIAAGGAFINAGNLNTGVISNAGIFTQTGSVVAGGNFTNSGTATIGGLQTWLAGTTFINSAGTAVFNSDAGPTNSTLAVAVTGGSVTFASTQHLASLNITSGTAQLVGGTTGHQLFIFTPSISATGSLDLTTNDLDVQGGNLLAVSSQIGSAFNGGSWTGSGITSSSAANDSQHLTAVGVLLNAVNSTIPLYTTFDGSPVALNDVLARLTYYGDTNLDGKVDGSDYSRIDFGYLAHATGWYNGDFNYDGVINGSDYTLIDNAFNRQSAVLTAEIAVPTSALPAPEPTCIGVVGFVASCICSRRRRFTSSQL